MNRRGFSLVELMVAFAIILVVAALTIPLAAELRSGTDLREAKQDIKSDLIKQRAQARAGYQDEKSGLYVTSSIYTLFVGESYALRDQAYDVTRTFAETITPSGHTEVVFRTGTGWPTATGTLTLTHSDGSVVAIDIGAYGQIE